MCPLRRCSRLQQMNDANRYHMFMSSVITPSFPNSVLSDGDQSKTYNRESANPCRARTADTDVRRALVEYAFEPDRDSSQPRY